MRSCSYTNLLPKDQSEPKLHIAQVTDYHEHHREDTSVKSPIHLPKAVVENFIVNPSRVTNQMRQQMKEKRQIQQTKRSQYQPRKAKFGVNSTRSGLLFNSSMNQTMTTNVQGQTL